LIRSTLAAVQKQLPVLWAKLGVFTGVVFVISLAASFAAFLGGRAILGSDCVSLSDLGLLRVVVGTLSIRPAPAYSAGVWARCCAPPPARSPASSASCSCCPASPACCCRTAGGTVTPYLPSNAGSAFAAVTQSADHLSPWAGLVVFVGYLVVAVLGAAGRLKTRDA